VIQNCIEKDPCKNISAFENNEWKTQKTRPRGLTNRILIDTVIVKFLERFLLKKEKKNGLDRPK